MKWLSICLAFGLLCAPLSALPSPSPPSGSVSISQSEYDRLLAIEKAAGPALVAMEAAEKSLEQSSQTISDQSTRLKRLGWLCGALSAALVIDAVAHVIEAVKR
jgi:hypothetical protein